MDNNEVRYFRLIIRLPGSGDMSVYNKSMSRIYDTMAKYVPHYKGERDPFIYKLSSGLPIHFPYAFEEAAAKSLKADLESIGCMVRVTDSGA